MKLLKKIIPFVVVLATVFSVFGVQNTFADSQIKKRLNKSSNVWY